MKNLLIVLVFIISSCAHWGDQRQVATDDEGNKLPVSEELFPDLKDLKSLKVLRKELKKRLGGCKKISFPGQQIRELEDLLQSYMTHFNNIKTRFSKSEEKRKATVLYQKMIEYLKQLKVIKEQFESGYTSSLDTFIEEFSKDIFEVNWGPSYREIMGVVLSTLGGICSKKIKEPYSEANPYPYDERLDFYRNEIKKAANTEYEGPIHLAKVLFKKHYEQKKIKKEMRPILDIYRKGSDNVVIIIHGLGSSPYQMNQLQEYFNKKKKAHVINILLPKHGHEPEDLIDISYKEWIDEVVWAYSLATLLGKNIYLVGFSTGGVLSIDFVANNPDKIKGLFLLSPAIDFNVSLFRAVQHLKKIMDFPPPKLKEDNFYGYVNLSLSSIDEVRKLMDINRLQGDKMTIPTFITTLEVDGVLSPKATEKFYKSIKTKDKFHYIHAKSLKLGHADIVRSFWPYYTTKNPGQKKAFEMTLNMFNHFISLYDLFE